MGGRQYEKSGGWIWSVLYLPGKVGRDAFEEIGHEDLIGVLWVGGCEDVCALEGLLVIAKDLEGGCQSMAGLNSSSQHGCVFSAATGEMIFTYRCSHRQPWETYIVDYEDSVRSCQRTSDIY